VSFKLPAQPLFKSSHQKLNAWNKRNPDKLKIGKEILIYTRPLLDHET
jgi:hypothetical protein